MDNQKRSFLLYMDAAPVLRQLTDAQRGRLLMALYDYAGRLSREDVSPEQAAPDSGLDPTVQAVFLFMAAAIRRDTEKWRKQRESYYRNAKGTRGSREPAKQSGSEDLSWARYYIHQRDRKLREKEAEISGAGPENARAEDIWAKHTQ